ncbi:GDSL family lipase, partial [Candidatus Thiomargarita nelsonii]
MKNKFLLKYILILCYLPIQAWSFPYSEIYVFGDSLSDTGRLFEAIELPSVPYSEGRFSDGEVWVEILAEDFLDLSYNPQTNFAWGGATTGTTNVFHEDLPGLQQQVDTYLEKAADPNGLYVIWAGSNDFLSGVTNPEQT